MPPVSPIHEVYHQQLLPLGHGYPLWDAEPEDKRFEIEIGTVGRMDAGKFWLLFNAMKTADDPYQKHGVPVAYEPFRPPTHAPQGPWEKIKFPLVVSQTVCNRDIAAALQAGTTSGTVSLGASLKFDCRENKGAFLLLERPAIAVLLPAKEHIARYMRDNFDHWLEFANTENGLMLRPEQIYFVYGTVKTSKWATGAFQGNCRNKEGSVQAQCMNVGNFDLSISISTEEYTRMEYNYGPTGTVPPVTEAFLEGHSSEAGRLTCPDATTPTPKCDQCVFFNYFKAKRRFMLGPRYMEAAAGPHELPPDDPRSTEGGVQLVGDDDDRWSLGDFEEGPGSTSEPPADPVDHLLDYILDNSDAQIAIACDADVYALFPESGFPPDISAALASMKPSIRIDDGRAGTLAIDITHPKARETHEDVQCSVTKAGISLTVETTPANTFHGVIPAAQKRPHSLDDSETEPPTTDPEQQQSSSWYRVLRGYREKIQRKRRKWPRVTHDSSHSIPIAICRALTATALSLDQKLIAEGYTDGTLVLHFVSLGRSMCARDDTPRRKAVCALAFAPDNMRLACAKENGAIAVWGTARRGRLGLMHGHSQAVTILAWSSDGTRLASASEDFVVCLWDATTYRLVSSLEGHDEPLAFLTFSPNSWWLVSGGEDGYCLLWNVVAGTLHQELDGHEETVRSADFDAHSARIVTCSDDTTARVWSVDTGEELLCLAAHRSPVIKATFSRDGRRILTVSCTTAKIFDAGTGEKRSTFKGESVVRRAFSALERTMAVPGVPVAA
ncbi:WD40-repeat-containing domain protein [Trametes polyzona]|nr:WD40-repeat-containing domain protein [Trametes polyzona]